MILERGDVRPNVKYQNKVHSFARVTLTFFPNLMRFRGAKKGGPGPPPPPKKKKKKINLLDLPLVLMLRNLPFPSCNYDPFLEKEMVT